MRWFCLMLGAVALGTFGLRGGPVLAQPGQSESQQLRQLVATLQQQVERLQGGSPQKERVTQLGSTPMRYYEEDPRMVVRIYDLSDLFALAPRYPAMHAGDFNGQPRLLFPAPGGGEYSGGAAGMGAGGMGGMGGMGGAGMFNVPGDQSSGNAIPRHVRPQMSAGSLDNDAARTSIDQLINAITSTISPTDWDEVGGEGSIAQLGNELLISASAETHEQIDALLDNFRKRWGTLRTVSVQANWMWLTQHELARILAASKVPADEIPAYGLVDDEAWRAILEHTAKPEAERPAGYHAVVTCYNGQTVNTVSGGESLAITGMIPVVGGGKEEPGYSPVIATIQTGAAMQVTPIVSTSGKYVVLDMHSRVVQCNKPEAAPAPESEPAGLPLQLAAAIDRPQLNHHRLATTLRLPVDRRMLVGGMTFEGQPAPDQPGLYLFVKASVQELRDDATERSTSAEPGAAEAEKAEKAEKAKPAAAPAKKTPRRK